LGEVAAVWASADAMSCMLPATREGSAEASLRRFRNMSRCLAICCTRSCRTEHPFRHFRRILRSPTVSPVFSNQPLRTDFDEDLHTVPINSRIYFCKFATTLQLLIAMLGNITLPSTALRKCMPHPLALGCRFVAKRQLKCPIPALQSKAKVLIHSQSFCSRTLVTRRIRQSRRFSICGS